MRVYNTPGLSYDDLLIAPDYSDIESRSDIDLKTRITKNVHLDMPLVSSPMDTVTWTEMAKVIGQQGGIGFLHRYCSIEDQVDAASSVKKSLSAIKSTVCVFGAAVGIKGDYLERAQELEKEGANVILIDVAHADHKMVVGALRALRDTLEVDILVGNVATGEAATRLIMEGADGIRAGIGSGSHCTTRLAAGVGIPQASAVDSVVQACFEHDVPVCADGGIRFPGDAAKAIGLGASTIMCGSVLAGTTQSPGNVTVHGYGPTARKYKEYRGMASHNAKQEDDRPVNNIEGVSTLVPYKGVVYSILDEFLDGIRSGMSYVGARDLNEMHRKCTFVLVTPNANHLHKRNGI